MKQEVNNCLGDTVSPKTDEKPLSDTVSPKPGDQFFVCIGIATFDCFQFVARILTIAQTLRQ